MSPCYIALDMRGVGYPKKTYICFLFLNKNTLWVLIRSTSALAEVLLMSTHIMFFCPDLEIRGHSRGRFGRKCLPKLADFSLSWAEGEVKMYRMYREIQNLDQNLPEILKLSQNFSLSESSRMTPGRYDIIEVKKMEFVTYSGFKTLEHSRLQINTNDSFNPCPAE